MNNWFSMKKTDFICFVALVILCVISFLPIRSTSLIYGIALFGWVQGLLMFAAPLVTLFFVLKSKSSK